MICKGDYESEILQQECICKKCVDSIIFNMGNDKGLSVLPVHIHLHKKKNNN